jgi:hypothetical protein
MMDPHNRGIQRGKSIGILNLQNVRGLSGLFESAEVFLLKIELLGQFTPIHFPNVDSPEKPPNLCSRFS